MTYFPSGMLKAGLIKNNPPFTGLTETCVVPLYPLPLTSPVSQLEANTLPPAMGSLGLGVMAGAMTLHDQGEHLEALWTIVGVSLLAFGHRLNRLALD